jgi:signal transduction histidine kinase
MQQSYAKVADEKESINITNLVEDSLRMNAGALNRHNIRIVRDFDEVPPLPLHKHKVLQILINLVRNAKYACDASKNAEKIMTLSVKKHANHVAISVTDNGIGIPPENLDRIFEHGFTTRKSGHGFGLNGAAMAAKEMDGSLIAHSDGPGRGATFTLELPLAPPVSPRRVS